MQNDQSKILISRRQAIGGLLATGAALSTGLPGAPSAFASTHLSFAQPAPIKFKATIKTSKVALKHQKLGKKGSKVALKTYKLKTNNQAAPLSAQDLKATFTSFPVKTTSWPGLGTIVTGDTGSDFWFAETAANRIGKITTQGAITEYLLPLDGFNPYSIANGPDDTLWFPYTTFTTNPFSKGYIGRIVGGSGEVTLYQLPDDTISSNSRITRGPNDTLWFTSGSKQIGSATADGALTIYTLDHVTVSLGIASGADGALWFTYSDNTINGGAGVARITTDGSVTFYPVPNADVLRDIKTGRNNDLWFTVSASAHDEKVVGRITVDGTLTLYYMSQLDAHAYPYAIAHLGNGTFAFGTIHGGSGVSDHQYIGTITPAGDVQVFETPNGDQVEAMAYAGWANEVWFTSTDKNNSGKDKVYKFRVTG